MTDSERRLWVEKCSEILQLVLVEIRSLSWEDGHAAQINQLADIAHNIPQFMVGRDDFVVGHLRDEFVRYARKYWPGTDPALSKYVSILDMNEAAFNDLYRTQHPWPESAAAAN